MCFYARVNKNMCNTAAKCILLQFFLVFVYHTVISETKNERHFQSELQKALEFHQRIHKYMNTPQTPIRSRTSTTTKTPEWQSKRNMKEVILNKFYKTFAAILRSLDDNDLLTMVQAADDEIGDGNDEGRLLLRRTFAKDPFIQELTTPTALRNLDLDTPEFYGFVRDLNAYYAKRFSAQAQLKHLYRNLTNIFVRELEREFNDHDHSFRRRYTKQRDLDAGTKNNLVNIVKNAVSIFKSHPSLDDNTKNQIHFTLKTLWDALNENNEGETEEYAEKTSKSPKARHKASFRYSLRDLLNILNFMMESEVWQRTRLIKDSNQQSKSKRISTPSPQFLEFYNIKPRVRKIHKKVKKRKEYKIIRGDKKRNLMQLLESKEYPTTPEIDHRRATKWIKWYKHEKRSKPKKQEAVHWDNSVNIDVVADTWQDRHDSKVSSTDKTTIESDEPKRQGKNLETRYKTGLRQMRAPKRNFWKPRDRLNSAKSNKRKARLRKSTNKKRYNRKRMKGRHVRRNKLPIGSLLNPSQKIPRKLRYFSRNRTYSFRDDSSLEVKKQLSADSDYSSPDLNKVKPSRIKLTKLQSQVSGLESEGLSIEMNDPPTTTTARILNIAVNTYKLDNATGLTTNYLAPTQTTNIITKGTSKRIKKLKTKKKRVHSKTTKWHTPLEEDEGMSIEFISLNPVRSVKENYARAVTTTTKTTTKLKKIHKPKRHIRTKLKDNKTEEIKGNNTLQQLPLKVQFDESPSSSIKIPNFVPVFEPPHDKHKKTKHAEVVKHKKKSHNKTSLIIKLNETLEEMTTLSTNKAFEISVANFSSILAHLKKNRPEKIYRRDGNSTFPLLNTDVTINNSTLITPNITKIAESTINNNNKTTDYNTTRSSEEISDIFVDLDKLKAAEKVVKVALLHLTTTTVSTTPLVKLIQNLIGNSDQVVDLIMRATDDKDENGTFTQNIVNVMNATMIEASSPDINRTTGKDNITVQTEPTVNVTVEAIPSVKATTIAITTVNDIPKPSTLTTTTELVNVTGTTNNNNGTSTTTEVFNPTNVTSSPMPSNGTASLPLNTDTRAQIDI